MKNYRREIFFFSLLEQIGLSVWKGDIHSIGNKWRNLNFISWFEHTKLGPGTVDRLQRIPLAHTLSITTLRVSNSSFARYFIQYKSSSTKYLRQLYATKGLFSYCDHRLGHLTRRLLFCQVGWHIEPSMQTIKLNFQHRPLIEVFKGFQPVLMTTSVPSRIAICTRQSR